MSTDQVNIKDFQTVLANKSPLFEQLPLDVPLVLMVDPCNLCNFKCTFCPTGDTELLKSVNRPKGLMKEELFYKIIDDVDVLVKEKGKKLNKLTLYKDGEPLVHKKLGELIAYAKKKDVAKSVQTTTNGAILDEKRAIELIESGLDEVRISVEHVNDKGYKDVTLTYANYEQIRKNVKFIYEEKIRRKSSMRVYAKIIDYPLSEEDKLKFKEDFEPITDVITIEKIMGWSMSDAKDFTLGKDKYAFGEHERVVCPRPFYTLSVNFDGQVSVCCVDWSFGTVVGDLKKESLKDVWNGEQLKEFRLMQLKGERKKNSVCASCHYLNCRNDDMLDDKTQPLIDMYSN